MKAETASPASFYRRQAEVQRAAADASDLARVRVRCDRAAAAWTAMAIRAEQAELSWAVRS